MVENAAFLKPEREHKCQRGSVGARPQRKSFKGYAGCQRTGCCRSLGQCLRSVVMMQALADQIVETVAKCETCFGAGVPKLFERGKPGI